MCCFGASTVLFATFAVTYPWHLQDRALELPKEHEMPAKDKYTIFSKTAKGYRKGIHKVPKWTRVRRLLLHSKFLVLILMPADPPDEPQGFLNSRLPPYFICIHRFPT